MTPVALEYLLRRLARIDRKRLVGAAMICAELYNTTIDRKAHPEAFTAADFLPELPEERRARELEIEAVRTAPIDPKAFAAWKGNLLKLAKKSSS